MTSQSERFLDWMAFKPVDRIPLMEMGYWPETFERWYHEGLPYWVTDLHQAADYLGLDRSFNRNWLPINTLIYPAFERRVIEETDDVEVVRDEAGVLLRQRKRFKTIPQYLRFPVENEADYEGLLPRLDGSDSGRYPEDFEEDVHWRRWRGEIVGLNFTGFFGYPRGLMGLEGYCMAFYDQPGLVRRMIRDRVQFARQVLQRALATRQIDFVQIWEDMAFKTASLVSPKLVRQFMLPAYEELVEILRRGGVKLIMVDCDGHVNDLLPIYRAAGIDGVHPCEMAAGADPTALRRLAPGCTLMGGLDKRLIAAGREGVDAELRRIGPLLAEGAYIPFLDHFVPPDVPFDTYRYYIERRRELLSKPTSSR